MFERHCNRGFLILTMLTVPNAGLVDIVKLSISNEELKDKSVTHYTSSPVNSPQFTSTGLLVNDVTDTIGVTETTEIGTSENSDVTDMIGVTETPEVGTPENNDVTDMIDVTETLEEDTHEEYINIISEDVQTIRTVKTGNVSFSNSSSDDIYYVYIPFGIFSVAGNIAIIAIMTNFGNRGKSTSLLFIILAISDTAQTINNMYYCIAAIHLHEGINWVFGVITNLIFRMNVQFSNYILAVITIERVISVAEPFRVKTISTKRNVMKVTITILVVILAVNIPLWLRDYPTLTMETLDGVDLAIGFLIPFFSILIGGLYIAVKMKYRPQSNAQYNSVTNIVLAANLAFLITMLPRRIIYLMPTGSRDDDQSNLLLIAFQFLECLNTGVNFFVYILAGKKFRDDFKNLVRCKRMSSSRDSSKTNSKIKDGGPVSSICARVERQSNQCK